jgi:hypothetical protein
MSLRFEAESIDAVYEGKINNDKSEIAGEFKQGGRVMPLVFKRSK